MRLTSSCILRVLASPPIPPGALPGVNTLGLNCLNYETCIKNLKNFRCVNLFVLNTQNILENLIIKFIFKDVFKVC